MSRYGVSGVDKLPIFLLESATHVEPHIRNTLIYLNINQIMNEELVHELTQSKII
jgi:ribosomal protein L30/L7E